MLSPHSVRPDDAQQAGLIIAEASVASYPERELFGLGLVGYDGFLFRFFFLFFGECLLVMNDFL